MKRNKLLERREKSRVGNGGGGGGGGGGGSLGGGKEGGGRGGGGGGEGLSEGGVGTQTSFSEFLFQLGELVGEGSGGGTKELGGIKAGKGGEGGLDCISLSRPPGGGGGLLESGSGGGSCEGVSVGAIGGARGLGRGGDSVRRGGRCCGEDTSCCLTELCDREISSERSRRLRGRGYSRKGSEAGGEGLHLRVGFDIHLAHFSLFFGWWIRLRTHSEGQSELLLVLLGKQVGKRLGWGVELCSLMDVLHQN